MNQTYIVAIALTLTVSVYIVRELIKFTKELRKEDAEVRGRRQTKKL